MTVGKINLLPGSTVRYQGKLHVILDIAGLDAVVAEEVETSKTCRISIGDLIPDTSGHPAPVRQDLLAISEDDWEDALRRLEIIQPLLSAARGQITEMTKRIAKENGVDAATIYRWRRAYEKSGLLSSLLRTPRNDKGKSRFQPEVEEIMNEMIRTEYLCEERKSPADVWELIKMRCRELKLPVPHSNTVRNRIAKLSEETKVGKRLGKKAAKERFRPHRGSFPGADFPLAVVQIDHTPMDIIVVDELHRKPIGRPYLTLAIDVFSRVVCGYCISLDPPGALSTGLCLVHAVLPKDSWLAKMNIITPWPVWGIMRVVHTDNAKEFRGTMLGMACNEYGIELEQRPKGEPQYGGHVERSFRTYMSKLHNLPGTTRSNVQDKGDYDAEGKACLTLSALERWFAIFIVEYYHQKAHSGNNGVPPVVVYERGLLGSKDKPGVGLPAKIVNETKFKLDFLPYELRTVQEYGIVNEKIYYWHDSLQIWIHALDPDDPKRKRKFIVRYDPRDLSTVYFLNPETNEYIPVPYRDIRKPPISIWELRAAQKQLKEDGYTDINEELIFGALRKMTDLVAAESAKTKKVRRQEARRKGWKKSKEHMPQPASGHSSPPVDEDIFSQPIIPFDDLEVAP